MKLSTGPLKRYQKFTLSSCLIKKEKSFPDDLSLKTAEHDSIEQSITLRRSSHQYPIDSDTVAITSLLGKCIFCD